MEVFNMSRKQLMSYKEIAAKLGISEKTVKAHIHQVLKKIRPFLKKGGIDFIFFLFLTKP
jgi:RNA polymerase sigma-70 factor (ECF subfamily)